MNACVTDEHRIVPLRDAAYAAGVSERTLRGRLQRHGISCVAVTPKKIGVRKADFERYLQDCEV